MSSSVRSVEILSLGDELLLGLRLNSHLQFLGESLAAHGLIVRRGHELPDDPAVIREAFTEAWGRADLIITTGGLGPTTDDLTRETMAAVLGRPLIHDASQETILREHFAKRGFALTSNNLAQCQRLSGAEFIRNDFGSAPGQWLEADGKLLIMLPGPPRELQPMYHAEVLPLLIAAGWAQRRDAFLQLRTSGLGESHLAAAIEPLLIPYAGKVQVAYCAHEGSVDVRLSPVGDALDAAAIQSLGETLKDSLGEAFSHFGEEDLAAHILGQLRARGRTLAVAEASTGGLLASRFTDFCGANKVFMGGLVCYRNQVKEQFLGVPADLIAQHGAVSPEVAVAMAEGAAEHFEADYALSITGYAGPECGQGGTAGPGTIYLGLSTPIGVWAKKIHAPGTRAAAKVRAVNGALDFLRRKLRQYEVHDFLDQLCI